MHGLAALTSMALFMTPALASAQEEAGSEATGAWHGTFQLDRDDPRIRTRDGADLLRIQVIHSSGAPLATISWVAGRAICEDPAAEPCDWVGTSGMGQARVLQHDLVFTLPLSAEAEDPVIVILRKSAGPQAGVGQMMNSQAEFAYDFTYSDADGELGE